MIKFIHTADIHLDSPLHGLERYEGAPVDEIREAPRRAFKDLIDYAISEEISFLLIAGDLYDGDWKDFNTGLFFSSQMKKLKKAGIKVFIINGNHDAASIITKNLAAPENVKAFSSKRPETIILDEFNIALHGQSFTKRDVSDNLAAGYPAAVPGMLNIGLLHTGLTGREGHEPYAPCKTDDLISKGYDYWALGHIHKREIVFKSPWIVFPGNLQGRNIKETGEKGATIVTIDDDNEIADIEHVTFDSVRWQNLSIDVSEAESGYDVLETIKKSLVEEFDAAGDRLLAVRLSLTGASQAHSELVLNQDHWVNQIRASGLDVDEAIWVEKVRFKTKAAIDIDSLLEHSDPVSDLIRSIRGVKDAEDTSFLLDEFRALRTKLPSEYRELEGSIDLENSDDLIALLEDVEQFLIPKILEKSDETELS